MFATRKYSYLNIKIQKAAIYQLFLLVVIL